jgi:quinolinate synthase
MADMVCSTELMVGWCKQQTANTIIIATESGMIHRLRKEVPGKTFVAAPTDRCSCNDCKFMKMNTLTKVRDCLRTEPRDLPARSRARRGRDSAPAHAGLEQVARDGQRRRRRS